MEFITFLQSASPSSSIMSWLPLILIFGVLYFFMIRPQAKKQKEQNKFLGEIQKGDEVVTSSGMIGKINKIEGNTITLQVDTKTFIKVVKGALSNEMTVNHQKANTETEASS